MDESLHCWKCRQGVAPPITFRSLCPHCSADLHCCVACRFYAVGQPNDCSVPDTEWVRDKEKHNFCEEFRPSLSLPPENKAEEAKERARRLLGF